MHAIPNCLLLILKDRENKMRLGCCFLLGSVSYLIVQVSAGAVEVKFPSLKGHHQYAGCPGDRVEHGAIPAVDVSNTIDDSTLNGLRETGVKLVFRYYDWEDDLSKRPPSVRHPYSARRTPFGDK